MKTVRFAIVGVGNIAELHAQAIELADGGELVACHSRSPDAASEFARRHRCECAPDLESLMQRDDCDALVIATPSGTYAEMGILAARHGKHVFCEKPLDISLEKIDELISCCEDNGLLLGWSSKAGLVRRHAP